ncbi:acetyl-CoA synthetase-like protein [Schizophyllum commune Loenen D]|nr:acetyl-CoA synthetase-like protein [Schizophyllum commune Loenen D]
MGNNSSYAMLQWACASIGAILVTINPAYRINELIQTLSAVGVKHLICVPRIRSSAYLAMLADAAPGIRNSPPGEISDPKLPELRNMIVMDNRGEYRNEMEKLEIRSLVDWREILLWREDTREEKARRVLEGSMGKDDVINLQFTSGTTGLPKAVSLTHHNLLNNGLSVGRCMRLTDKDILCKIARTKDSSQLTLIIYTQATSHRCFTALMSIESLPLALLYLPFPASSRLVLGNLAAWTHGACIVYPSPVFDPPAIVDAVIEERCTALHGVPTHFLGVLSEVDKRRHEGERVDLSHLRTGIAAGSSIPIDLMKRLIEHMNLRELTNAYGMTETSPVSFQTVPEDPIIKRVETVGRVQPHVKAKIVDGNGNVVPVGTPGQLLVAGYLLQKGYWNDDAQTQAVMKQDENGTLWMHTGDEGIMDEDGYLRIVGRIKDIIIRGGENLFPVQIENALTDHPGIREAAAIAVPDTKYGEVVGAWIAREPGTEVSRAEVRRAVADAMNPQNAPAWVWFLGEEGVVDELPKTASGKVQKHILRSWSKPLVEKKVGQV